MPKCRDPGEAGGRLSNAGGSGCLAERRALCEAVCGGLGRGAHGGVEISGAAGQSGSDRAREDALGVGHTAPQRLSVVPSGKERRGPDWVLCTEP